MSAKVLNEFSRTRLLLGERTLAALANARIAVFGLGGVGSYAVEALARCGVGALDIIDDDLVCITNINRQLIALHSTIGRKKTDVMRERILDINPKCVVTAHDVFYSEATADRFDMAAYSYVVDAIDTVTAKLTLIMRAQAAGTPVISCMGAGNKLDPAMLTVSDIYKTSVCPLAKVMRRELRKRGVEALKVVYSREKPLKPDEEEGGSCRDGCVCPPGAVRNCAVRRQIPGSVSFVPSVAGLIIAGEVVRDLVGEFVEGENE